MTAAGKITSNRLRAGDVVLYAAHPSGETWVPAHRRDRGTYAGTVDTVTATLVRRPGDRRAQRWYDVQLRTAADPTARPVTVRCSPASTWWLASASSKWRAFLGLAPGDRTMIKSATERTEMPTVDTETHAAMTAALDFVRRRLHLVRTALDEYARECENTADAFSKHVAACEADPDLAAKTNRGLITVNGYRQLADTNRQAAARTREAMAELDAFEEAHTW